MSQQKEIQETLEIDSQILANISDGIFLYTDKERRIIFTNAQFDTMFGYERNELLGKPVSILNAPSDKSPEETVDEILAILNQQGSWNGEIQNIKKDGTRFGTHAGITSFQHPEFGKVWLTVQQDITDRKLAEMQLKYLSIHDSLTDLYNRAFFDEEFNRLEKGRRLPISIITIDLDGLKYVNDHYGHAIGDQLLKRTARVLNQSFRGEDVIARIGGDEFAILLPNTKKEAALEAVQRIRKNLEADNLEQEIQLRLSIGTSTALAGPDLKRAMAGADQNMYKQKRKNKHG